MSIDCQYCKGAYGDRTDLGRPPGPDSGEEDGVCEEEALWVHPPHTLTLPIPSPTIR